MYVHLVVSVVRVLRFVVASLHYVLQRLIMVSVVYLTGLLMFKWISCVI